MKKTYLLIACFLCVMNFIFNYLEVFGKAYAAGVQFSYIHSENNDENQEQELNNQSKLILSKMSMDEKIGQVLLLNFRTWGKDEQGNPLPFQECNKSVEDIIKKYHLGNIILFGENAKSTEKLVRLIDDMQTSAISSGNLPLLIGIDQEGGLVTRLGEGTTLPGNMALGASGKTENAFIAGQIIGEELAAVGVNCNFAPDSDVNDNPKNPVIHLRSFSSDPIMVSNMASAMVKGMQENNIIATAKHFPGHGNTNIDTHIGLAVVNKSEDEWNTMEAIPFKALIDQRIDMIMSAHIQYPKLDDTRYISKLTGEKIYLPATLSKKILTGILRDKLAFDGVIVTDAMDMKAIVDNFGETEAIIMALNAGADLICNPTSITNQNEIKKLDEIYDEIKQSIYDGRLSKQRLDEAAQSVIKLKMKYGILNKEKYQGDIDKKVENAIRIVGSKEHKSRERELADDAITLHSPKGYQPFNLTESEKVLFIVPMEYEKDSVIYAMERLYKEGEIPKVNVSVYCYNRENVVEAELKNQIAIADHIIIVSEMTAATLNDSNNWQIRMPGLIAQEVCNVNEENYAIISTGLPYDVANYPKNPVYLAYGYQRVRQEGQYGANLLSAIDCIMGRFSPKGKLPIKLDRDL